MRSYSESLSWLDRPINVGDRFVPRARCQVSSKVHAWLFEPDHTEGGRWKRVPLPAVPRHQDAVQPDETWSPYDWIVWHVDAWTYRLQIGGQLTDEVTGAVQDVTGIWTSRRGSGRLHG